MKKNSYRESFWVCMEPNEWSLQEGSKHEVNEWEHVWNTGSESKAISQTGLDKQSKPFICD